MRSIIRVDGTTVDLPEPRTMHDIGAIIGATTLCTITMKHMGRPLHVMLVDDAGIKKDLPVNHMATKLYWFNCVPGTTHQIRGDVVIVPDDDFA